MWILVAAISFVVGAVFGIVVMLAWMISDYDKAEAREPEREELRALYRRQEQLYHRARAHVGEKR